MRDGYRIIDTDTHVGPNVETLERYAGPQLRQRWDELTSYLQPVTDGGHSLSINPIPYRRVLGQPIDAEAAVPGGASPLKGNVTATLRVPVAEGINNGNPQGRLADMDREGVDAHLLIPGTFSTAVSALDLELSLEIYAAYHRFLADYCAADPQRLKATILVSGRDPESAAAEIKRLSAETWVAAVTVVLPEGLPLDEPSLHTVWSAMGDADLPILHHSFFYEPPYFPGYRDIWGNVVVARAAAHPWGAERLVAYLTLSGLLDQFPRLRIGFAECSAGWLPGWLVRLKGQADYMRARLPALEMDPLDYARSGRIYCGIELYEGEAMAKAIIDVCGDGVLMYQSDYPHPGCDFPDSPATVLGWSGISSDAMGKLLAGNATDYLRLL